MAEPILTVEHLIKAYGETPVLDVMLDLAKQGKTMIIVTHEMQFARAIANRVIFLDGGKIVEEAAPAEFFDRPKTERAQRFLRTFTFDAVK